MPGGGAGLKGREERCAAATPMKSAVLLLQSCMVSENVQVPGLYGH